MEAILKRRSIRKYTSQDVTEEQISLLLKAAMAAPSSGNQQPWQFVIINDKKILSKIPEFHPYSSMITSASAAILVCGDMKREKYKGWWVQDCSAATQNILIGITSLGLGGVWLGVYPRDQRIDGFRELLNLPEHIIPFSLISIGYPNEKKQPSRRYDESRIHWNRWND